MQLKHIGLFLLCISLVQCKTKKESEKPITTEAPEGMVYIPGGRFMQGAVASDQMAMAHEKPAHPVEVDAFFMSTHEVTNAQYLAFVEATGYITLAERAIDWEELKKQVPPGTPKPHDSILQPGSLLFYSPKQEVENLYDYTQWWEWKIGANWRQPYGPKVIYLDSKIFLLCISPMKTLWLTVNGKVNAYPPRQSGNLLQELNKKTTFTFGEMIINFSVLMPTLGMDFFLLKILKKMAT